MAGRMACLLILAHGTLAHCFVRGASCMARPMPAMLRSAVPPRLMRQPVRMASKQSAGPDVLEELSSVVAAEPRVSPTDEEISNLAKIFSVYDTSGDGSIDLEEMQAALARAGKPVSRQRAEEILRELDEDGDGEISLEELQQAFKLEEPGEGLAKLLDLFIKEVRFEISSTPFNGPILLTLSTAAFLGFFWKYIAAISLLYETELDWLPDSLSLLQTVPQGFLADYGSAVALAPLLTVACTSAFAYAAGDLVAQRVEGRWRVDLLDLGRCARNSALGFGLHGPLVYTWIKLLEGPLAETLAGLGVDSASWGILVLKIFLDQTIFSALLNILYASLNGVLSDLSPRQAFARALEVLPGAMVSSWRFWPAVQLISYSPLIPVDFKLLWIDTMEILWVAYLSATVNGELSAGEAEPATPSIPWGEGRLVERDSGALVAVLDEPGDSDLLYVGPLALYGSMAALAAVSWPALVVQLMNGS